MTFPVSFFLGTSSNMDVTFYLPTNFITVGIKFKYSFQFRPKKIVLFKQYKTTTDTDVTVICDPQI